MNWKNLQLTFLQHLCSLSQPLFGCIVKEVLNSPCAHYKLQTKRRFNWTSLQRPLGDRRKWPLERGGRCRVEKLEQEWMYGLSDQKMAVVERWPLRLVGVRLCNKLFTVWTQQGPGVSIQKLNTPELPYKNAQTHSFFLLQTTKQCHCTYKSLPAACSGVLFVTLS